MKRLFLGFLISVQYLFTYEAQDFPYLYDMEGFTKELFVMHVQLYKGYVKNATYLHETLQHINPKSYEYGALKRRFGWEFDGMRLHELYFGNLGGNGKRNEKSSLFSRIKSQYGSYENWRQEFIDTGLIRGIGWVILYYDPISEQLINCWINEHDLGHLVRGFPILVLDVWEHAYMPEFKLNRSAYIDVYFKNLDWNVIERRYDIAIEQERYGA